MNTGTDLSYMLSCDWGTTSFRLSLVNYQTGKLLKTIASSRGVQSINSEGSAGAFQTYLTSQIDTIEEQSSRRLESVPIVISGMASSSIGWKELPYGPLPFSLNNPQLPIEYIPATQIFPHNILLVSGICSSDEVMRGEETQVLGLASRYDLENAVCILPGTHSKHVYIEGKKITSFKTYMTGELFELISTKSILKNSVTYSEGFSHENAFKKGVEKALQFNFLNKLFSIRTNDLLNQSDHKKNYNFLSGLLIGSELKELVSHRTGKIYIAGADALQHRYVIAANVLGIDGHSVKNASVLTVQGHRFILNHFNQKKRNL